MSTELPLPVREALPRARARACSPGVPCPSVAVAAAGQGRLAAAIVDGRSAIVECSATSPLHLFTPCARGRSVSILVATYGGGLLAGDAIDLSIEVRGGAVATVGTQAETKVYRSEGRWAEQRVEARVDAEASLAMVPEPTSCFAGARYRQHQRFELHPRASLLLLDAVTPGRSARGERWAFEGYLSRNEVLVGGRPVLCDALRLVPGEGPPVEQRMRGFEFLATVLAVGPALIPAATSILERIAARAARADDGVLAAASPLQDGVYLRVAARSVEAGLEFVRAQLALAATPFGRHALQRRS